MFMCLNEATPDEEVEIQTDWISPEFEIDAKELVKEK